jgi:hypothetical protein
MVLFENLLVASISIPLLSDLQSKIGISETNRLSVGLVGETSSTLARFFLGLSATFISSLNVAGRVFAYIS